MANESGQMALRDKHLVVEVEAYRRMKEERYHITVSFAQALRELVSLGWRVSEARERGTDALLARLAAGISASEV